MASCVNVIGCSVSVLGLGSEVIYIITLTCNQLESTLFILVLNYKVAGLLAEQLVILKFQGVQFLSMGRISPKISLAIFVFLTT